MTEEMWAELTAQVDEHGYGAIQFWLDEGLDEPFLISVDDVTFDDGAIKVKLS